MKKTATQAGSGQQSKPGPSVPASSQPVLDRDSAESWTVTAQRDNEPTEPVSEQSQNPSGDGGDGGGETAKAEPALPNRQVRDAAFSGKPAREFLKLLGKDPERAWLRALKPGGGASQHRGMTTADDRAWIDDKTRAGFNLYVVIGEATRATGKGGGVQDSDITAISAVFVEWDDGADINEQAARPAALELPEPTVMVSTGGKSVHAYWVLAAPMAPADWRTLQRRLIAHCNSDKACSNPSRLMRLPGSVYHDKKTGHATGFCAIISSSGRTYSPAAIEKCLPAPAEQKPVTAPLKRDWVPRSIDEINTAADFIPRRVGSEGTYERDWHALCGCSGAFMDTGMDKASADAAALALLGPKWPSEAEARQALESAKTRNAGSFWSIAAEGGYQLQPMESGSPTPRARGGKAKPRDEAAASGRDRPGRPIKLGPAEVAHLLPQRLGRIRRDVRSGDVMTDQGKLSGNEISRLYVVLSSHAETWPKDATADAVAVIASANTYDPVQQYLDGIAKPPLPMEQWQRLDQYLLGIDHPIAAQFLPRYFISAVARTMEPGCDVRQLPVLIGAQWRGKSRLGRILFGADHWIEGVGALDRDALQRAHMAWGVELAELDGVTRSQDRAKLKAFLTEQVDTFQIRYDKYPGSHPRRFVFWGTANEPPLADPTGSTRFVCIEIPDRMLPLDWAEANRDALWARALEQYRSRVQWSRISEQERRAIEAMNSDYQESDPWTDDIERHLDEAQKLGRLPVTIEQLLRKLGVPKERQTTAVAKRVRGIAERHGWRHRRARAQGKLKQGLWAPEPTTDHPDHGLYTPTPDQLKPSAGAASDAPDHPDHPFSSTKETKEEEGTAVPEEAVDTGASDLKGVIRVIAPENDCSAGDLSDQGYGCTKGARTWHARAAELRAEGKHYHSIALALEVERGIKVTGREVKAALT